MTMNEYNAMGGSCVVFQGSAPDIWHRMEPCATQIAFVLVAAILFLTALTMLRAACKASEVWEHTARLRNRLDFDERMRAHELRESWMKAKYAGFEWPDDAKVNEDDRIE